MINLHRNSKAIQNMHPPKMPKQVHAYLGLISYYRKFIKNFAKIAKPLTLLTHQQAKFEWTPIQHNAFLMLEESIIQAPILHYPNLRKCYIIYTDASDDACGAHLSQEHNDKEFPIAFLSHTFMETQSKWSTTEQEAYGVYYTITKWNKVNQWGLELATYNITFKWILGACKKAADCLSHEVELPQNQPKTIYMLSTTHPDGPAFHTRSRTAHQHSSNDPTPETDATAPVDTEPRDTTMKSLSPDRLEALLQL